MMAEHEVNNFLQGSIGSIGNGFQVTGEELKTIEARFDEKISKVKMVATLFLFKNLAHW